MKFTKSTMFSLTLAISLGLLAGACAKKETAVSHGTSHATGATTSGASTKGIDVGGDTVSEPSHQVYFAFDSSGLDAAARAILDANAEWLSTAPGSGVTVEGNCDERGTREYNLALGQRRADAIRAYLVSAGVDASRVDTISFGEERAACQDTGEACWAQNRRADIVSR